VHLGLVSVIQSAWPESLRAGKAQHHRLSLPLSATRRRPGGYSAPTALRQTVTAILTRLATPAWPRRTRIAIRWRARHIPDLDACPSRAEKIAEPVGLRRHPHGGRHLNRAGANEHPAAAPGPRLWNSSAGEVFQRGDGSPPHYRAVKSLISFALGQRHFPPRRQPAPGRGERR
jgi:hypothetical protein